jgi:ATP-dependent DNA helicase DinG
VSVPDLSTVAAALARVVAQLPGGGEPRPGQVAMAEAVARAIKEQRHLVVQAGTGTGKSLGYLVPAVESGGRVVVATATKNLQDQLAMKDLPFLAEHIGHPIAIAVLKGRGNYLCMQKLSEVFPGSSDEPTLDIDIDSLSGFGQELHLLKAWAGTTESGDRATLDIEPRPAVWAQLSVGPTECPGAAKCDKGDVCFAEKARRQAMDADVIVVNIALYAMHLVSGGNVLPPHDVVIFDEAHELEDVAASNLGLELSAGRFEAVARLAGPLAGKAASDAVAEAGQMVAGVLASQVGRAVDGGPKGLADQNLAAVLSVADQRSRALTAAIKAADAPEGSELAGRKARAQMAAGHLVADIAFVNELPATHVAWVEGSDRAPVLKVAAVDVGNILAEQLWGEVTGVLTSATVPPGIVRRLGLPAGSTDEMDAGSPFEHRSQAMLYVPKHLPDPRSDRYEDAMLEELAWLINAAGGRTLALFTSYRRMQLAADALDGTLPGPLLVQGQRPKPALIDEFTADESSSLFATMGFWQGIDVPGRTLSVVTIDRLPFARPDEPLWQARRDRAGDRAFLEVDVPRAATLLAQGAGRLLRTATDKGVVAVLDPRLATARYRADVLKPMPAFKRTIKRDEVEAFLAEALSEGAQPSASSSAVASSSANVRDASSATSCG